MTIEERLYNHWIYTNNLYNLCLDLQSDLEERGFLSNPIDYGKGKYLELEITNIDDTFEEILLFLLQEYDPKYLGSLGYLLDKNILTLFINI